MFTDRTHAGALLAEKLLPYKESTDLILGLARGGVVISSTISNILGIPHDALVVKKIGSPGNPELAMGARVPKGQHINVGRKSVLIVDDGMATGETMMAAIRWVQEHGAKKIFVAVPVTPQDTIDRVKPMVSEVIVLSTPSEFGAVGEFYQSFPQISDEEVVKLLQRKNI